MILCGVRDIPGSAFNIKAEALRLGDFTEAEVRRLYGMHTAETGQRFEGDIYPLMRELTRGQPGLVNALASESCFKLAKDCSRPITRDLILAAKKDLILEIANGIYREIASAGHSKLPDSRK